MATVYHYIKLSPLPYSPSSYTCTATNRRGVSSARTAMVKVIGRTSSSSSSRD